MQKSILLVAAVTLSACAMAAEPTPIAFDGQAPFALADVVAENIRVECNLTQYQGDAFRRAAEAASIPIELKAAEELDTAPRSIRLSILNAVSSGNAFIGHHKQVMLSAKLFNEGKQVAEFKGTRDSMGGFAAGFKSSCSVLERCSDTLAQDLVRWLKQQSFVAAAAETQTEEAPVSTETH